jgi:Tfp pilus assembly protein PilN
MNSPVQAQLHQRARRYRLLSSVWMLSATALLIVGAVLGWFAYDEYRRTLEQEIRFLDAHARIADADLTGLLRNLYMATEVACASRTTDRRPRN